MGHPKKEVQASQELLLTRHPVTQTLQKSLADWGVAGISRLSASVGIFLYLYFLFS